MACVAEISSPPPSKPPWLDSSPPPPSICSLLLVVSTLPSSAAHHLGSLGSSPFPHCCELVLPPQLRQPSPGSPTLLYKLAQPPPQVQLFVISQPQLQLFVQPPPSKSAKPDLPSLVSANSPSPSSTQLLQLLEFPPLRAVSMPSVHLLLENVGLKFVGARVFGLIIIKDPFNFSVDIILDGMRGSTALGRHWKLEIFGVTLDFLRLKRGYFYSCLRCFAALCRILLWFNALQSLVYLPPYIHYESLFLKSSDLHVVWVSALLSTTAATEESHYHIRLWWFFLVELPPLPPVPPDPPDTILSPLCPFVFWIRDSAVLTLSSLGDMSFVTALISIAFIPPFTQGLILSSPWNVWNLTGLGSIARSIASRLKLLSPHLPLYEDSLPLYEDPLPLYEDRFTLPLYEDRSTLPLYEEFVTLPLYEDLGSFMEFVTPLCSLFLNGCVIRDVIKGSFDRCLYASIAILEIGNCALAAVPISGVRSSAQGVILLNNSIVEEIRGLLEDFYLFKCYVAIIRLCLSTSFVVFSSFYATMAMLFENTYSFFGD